MEIFKKGLLNYAHIGRNISRKKANFNYQGNGVLLRKLDPFEVGMIKASFDQTIFFRLRLQSKIDIFEERNIQLFKKSILLWKRNQKLLSSRILIKNESDYFFEYVESNQFDNVHFLRYEDRNAGEDVRNSISDLLLEHSGLTEINPEKNKSKLLWHLYLYELDPVNYKFDVIGNFHHSFVQGESLIICIANLFNIFELTHKGEKLEPVEVEVLPGVESLFKLDKEFYELPKIEYPTPKLPSFVDPSVAKRLQLSQSPLQHLNPASKVVYVDSNQTFESVANLLEVSRTNWMKFKLFSVEGPKFFTFLKRLKSERAKFTGCFEVLACLAFKKLCEMYGSSQELDKIIFFSVMSLRSPVKKGSQVSRETLGYYGAKLLNVVDVGGLDREYWSMAREAGERFHNRSQSDEWKNDYRAAKPKDKDGLQQYFLLNNMGNLNFEIEYFKLENLCALPSMNSNNLNRLFFLNFITFNQKSLKIIINYNSYFIDSTLIDNYLRIILDLIELINKQ